MSDRRLQAGFTLIEVLVAVLVLGVSVSTFLALISQQTAQAGALETRMLARIAAENVMVEAMIAEEENTRDAEGITTVGDYEFTYRVERAPVDAIPGVEQVTVLISPSGNPDRVIAELESLVPPS